MTVTLRNLQRAIDVDLRLLLRQTVAFRNALQNGTYSQHDLTVLLVSNANMRRFNARYARRDVVTDVLAFPSAVSPDVPETSEASGLQDALAQPPPDLGTIVLAVPYCRRYARRRGISHAHYLAIAAAHATAHLGGHLHDDAASVAAMRAEEERLLRAAASVTPCESGALPLSYIEQ